MTDPKTAALRDEQKAEGTLARTPLAHVLVYAHNRSLTGLLVLAHGGSRDDESERVEIELREGRITNVRTSRPVAYLGQVLYELGLIDAQTMTETLAALASERQHRRPARFGDLLVARGVLSRGILATGLEEQLVRKTLHAFTLPEATTYVFHPHRQLEDDASAELAIIPLAWLGVRSGPSATDRAREVLSRLGSRLQLTAEADLASYGFDAGELAIAEQFRDGASTPEDRVGTLVAYMLAITKGLGPARRQTSSIPPSSSRTAPTASPPRVVPVSAPRAPIRFTTPPGMSAVREPRSVRVPVAPAVPPPAPPAGTHPEATTARPPRATMPSVSPTALRFSGEPKENIARAEVALQQKSYDVAEAYAKHAHEQAPRYADALALLGWLRTFRADGNTPAALSEAATLLEAALDLHPGLERAYMYRANIRKRTGDVAGAVDDYRCAAALNPHNVEATREVRLYDLRHKHDHDRKGSGLFERIKRGH